jgi:hypothetical protein
VTSRDLAHAAEVSYRRIDHWVQAGYLQVANGVEGSGTTREYHAVEVAVANALARLTDIGIEGELLRAVARAVRAGRPRVEWRGWVVEYDALRRLALTTTLPRGRGK